MKIKFFLIAFLSCIIGRSQAQCVFRLTIGTKYLRAG